MLVIQKVGVIGVPQGSAVVPSKFENGALHPSKRALVGSKIAAHFTGIDLSAGARDLTLGEKVYVAGIRVNADKDMVTFQIFECDSCNAVKDPASFKSEVIFQFPKGTLAGMELEQVISYIGEVFTVESSSESDQQSQTNTSGQTSAGVGQGDGNVTAASPNQAIEVGQTIEEVQQIAGSALHEVTALPTEQIYHFNGMKIVVEDGKVTQVTQIL